MLVDSIEISVNKNDAIKYLFRKTPLMSKIEQFNKKIQNVHLEYVEFKVLKYEITYMRKNKGTFRNDDIKNEIIMIVNTYNGNSQSVDFIPNTVKRYIARSHIKKSNINEEYIIEKVKNEIINHFQTKFKGNYIEKQSIKSIKILETSSIYKPYWIGDYSGKEVFFHA